MTQSIRNNVKDLAVSLFHLLYKCLHAFRKILLPSFQARRYKTLNDLIGKIMGMKVSRIRTKDGLILLLDEKDSLALSFNRVYEPEETALVKQTIQSQMRIIDIGANIGYYTTLFSKLATNGTVYAFEPDESNFRLLEKNCCLNELANVELFHCAVGDEDCSRQLFLSEHNMGDHRLYPIEESRSFSLVKMITIDQFLKSKKPFDFIKMDIQGFEMNALQGMNERITQDSPILLLEVWPEALLKNNVKPHDMLLWLNNHHYEVFDANDLKTKISQSESSHWIESIEDHANIFCKKRF
jgi:FkbM family methyltransferase